MFEWDQFLDLARQLGKQTDSEAALRSAISRAYYAVLGIAYLQLIDSGWILPQRGSMHHHVWSTYRDSGDSRREEVGEAGFNLRNARNFADYRRRFPDSLPLATTRALRSAQRMIALLHQIDADNA